MYQPMPAIMKQLKQKITDVFLCIPEKTVKKAVLSMESRAQKLVAVEGRGGFGVKL